MRRPTQHAIFDLPNFFGLANLLDRNVPAEQVVSCRGLQTTGVSNLWLLSAGRIPLDPAILLTSPNLALLMQALQERTDIVLLDSPPVLSAPDSVLLASECSATLLVVSSGVATRTALKKAKNELLQHEVNLVGLTFNNIKLKSASYYADHRKPARRLPLARLWARLPFVGANNHTVNSSEHLLSLREMSAYLGIQPRTARRWCKDGRIPAIKKKSRWYVREGDLQAMVMRNLLEEPTGESLAKLALTESAIAVRKPMSPHPQIKN
jgi:capsular exopolysaccharide synthesis family protein